MSSSSDSDPFAKVYHQAFQRYQEFYDDGKLKDEHFDLIKGHNTIEEVLDAIRNAKTRNESERNAVLRVIRRTSENSVGKLSRLDGVGSTAVEATPNVSVLVWGGVKLILVIARDIFDSYESACELCLRIIFALERFHDSEIFRDRTANLLEKRLAQFYDSILGFCIEATAFYLQGTVRGSPSSLRKSVSLEFTKLSSRLDSYAEQIYNPTDTENRQNTEGCKIIVITRSGGSNTEAMPVADQMVLAAPSVPKFLLASKDNTSAAHHWMVPYSRNRLFTGRKSTVEELDALASDSSYRRIALYGLGGIGKTQIAIEYAYRNQGQCHVFWVHASGRTKFSQDYKKISEVLGLSVQGSDANEEEILGNVKDWFESTASGEWLLFLDNADDISDFARNNSDISGSIPQGSKGTVIITTRSRQVASRLNCEAIAITAMNVEEATQLFSRRYGQHKSSHDLEAVSKLLESLDYLPLAVIGATSFMVEMDTSPSEYLELLNSTKQTQQDLLLTEFNDVHSKVLQNSGSDVTENVLDTYYITFKQIDRQLPLAADFLRLIAFLDPQGIPEELLAASELGDVSNKVLFRKAIGKLVDFSLVTRAEGGAMFTLHRLVHLSMITYLSLQEREEWRAKALKLVSRVFPEDPKYENRHICAIYLPHALAVTQNCDAPISASLLQCIARHLRQKGDIKNAEIYCRRSFALREAADKNGFDTLSSVCDLASVLDDRGMYEQAAQLYKRALEGYENGLGLQHPNTLAVINNIASVLTKQGKYTLAEDMHRRALETREKVLGPDHPDTFHSVNNLARVLQDKGKYAQAELMFRRAVKGRGKVLGRDHPSTLTSLFNLAAVLAQQGKSKQAEMMYRCVLEEQRKVLGPDHPSTLTTLNNLAQVLRDQAKYEEAEQLNRQAVLGNEKTLGPDHPDTLTSVDNLATVLDHLGKYEESEQMNRRALEGYERALGPDHPKTLASVNNMAVTLHNEGKYKQAELMFRRALEGGEKVLGPDHPGTLTSIWCMAGLYERQRRFPEAKDLYARASRGFLKALGNEHPHTLECLEGLQRMLGKLKAS